MSDDDDDPRERYDDAPRMLECSPRHPEDGTREYAARDPEGQVWSFGTYDPWA